MTTLEDLRPNRKPTIRSLLDGIGYDTAEWGHADNPKYCYEWGYRQGDLLVLNLWHVGIEPGEAGAQYRFNGQKLIAAYSTSSQTKPGKQSSVTRRGRRVIEILEQAHATGKGIRAVICNGPRRLPADPPQVKSSVRARMMDEELWSVSLGGEEGEYVLTRAGGPVVAVEVAVPAGPERTYLILAENEINATDAHDWRDVTGERYHFPNNYRNRIAPGARFIYYRGARRADGTRSEPAYFGHGVIVGVEQDPTTLGAPARDRQWIAEIDEFEPFVSEVAFRSEDGIYLEVGQREVAKNHWGTGVRTVSPEIFSMLLAAGGISEPMPLAEGEEVTGFASPEAVDVHHLWRVRIPAAPGGAGSGKSSYRRQSRRAKLVGDAAERIFFEYLCSAAADPGQAALIHWAAQHGETPGYDIEDRRSNPPECFEVKGTVGPQFLSIDLTLNELECAKRLGARYNLVLVTNVLGKAPKIAVLNDPAARLISGELVSTPVTFRIDMSAVPQAVAGDHQ